MHQVDQHGDALVDHDQAENPRHDVAAGGDQTQNGQALEIGPFLVALKAKPREAHDASDHHQRYREPEVHEGVVPGFALLKQGSLQNCCLPMLPLPMLVPTQGSGCWPACVQQCRVIAEP